ncbi:DUF378 domain-containing protein [Pasteuria penetrans]|uniref:DUF378 domain-containing protein n=1 Tax=Pasteuria penetrans TaxID=86005 RepID=UPI000F96AC0B|nr:DUF378 domain-containing protein [Pasteuria penetrans]
MKKMILGLVIFGALNWLLVGIFQWDLISTILGGDSVRISTTLSRILYTLIGIAGVYSIGYLVPNRMRMYSED